MLHIPSVEEWWRLTEKYPEFRKPSNLTLKEYGYMRLFELIEEQRPRRVLEFGHGFSSTLFEYCSRHGIEVWGVDDHMNLPYFPPKEVWHARYKQMLRDPFPDAKLILGQLGTRPDTMAELPNSYFDLVCSVSVLEEIGDEGVALAILKHAAALLKPDGVLANTHDIVFENPRRSKMLVGWLRAAGFDVELTDREMEILEGSSRYVPMSKALLENPTQAMLCYNLGDAGRVYSGHWSTLFSGVRKVGGGKGAI
jgi:SAM-dependent methyltransferase